MTQSLIEAAFRKLPILSNEEWRMPSIVCALAGIAEANSAPIPDEPKDAGRAVVQRQLDDIAQQCSKLASAFDALSRGARDALADCGLLQMQHREVSVVLGPQGERASDIKTYDLPAVLRKVSRMAENANTDALPENANGRQRNHLAGGVATILAKDYWRLTGKKPTRANRAKTSRESEEYSPFYELVKDVFLAIGIDASPAAYAKEAVSGFMEEKPE